MRSLAIAHSTADMAKVSPAQQVATAIQRGPVLRPVDLLAAEFGPP